MDVRAALLSTALTVVLLGCGQQSAPVQKVGYSDAECRQRIAQSARKMSEDRSLSVERRRAFAEAAAGLAQSKGDGLTDEYTPDCRNRSYE